MGISHSPPKLVYRTSKVPFLDPTGPEAYRYLKHLYPVHDHKLADNWDDLRHKIRDILDNHHVYFSTIDLVRFRTVPRQQTPSVISPVVVWVGVLPNSLAAEDAFNSANDILALLKDEGVTDVDVEFRESVFRRSARTDMNTELYAPAYHLDATKHVIDPLTTALGFSIASAKTPHLQGTMGFYFKDGDDLYGVTARHVLFPADEINSDYTYNPGRTRKDVLLMGTEAWKDYLNSVQIEIAHLSTMMEIHTRSIERLEERAGGNTPAAEKATKELQQTRKLLAKATEAIDKLYELYKRTKSDFGEQSQRVIGHVVWSPAMTVGTAPYDFTKDVCVVKLDKARFLRNFRGNVIDLGTVMEAVKLMSKIRPSTDREPRFKYPAECLLELTTILPESRMRHPDTQDHDGGNSHYVIKRGLASLPTIGRTTGYFSCVREYFPNGTHRDSSEWTILPYSDGRYASAFAVGGDSGCVVALGTGEYGGIVTAGSGRMEFSDTTYATPMFWLWSVIKAQFPNANLDLAF